MDVGMGHEQDEEVLLGFTEPTRLQTSRRD